MNFSFFLKAKVGFEVRYSNVILLNTAFIAYYYGKMKEDVLFRDILFFIINVHKLLTGICQNHGYFVIHILYENTMTYSILSYCSCFQLCNTLKILINYFHQFLLFLIHFQQH